MGKNKLFVVGEYTEVLNLATGQSLPCGPIYQSVGLRVHIQKRHPDELANLDHVTEVIAFPDYVGKNPNEADSAEFVKVLDKNVVVCVKMDKKADYLYVSSVYPISAAKLRNRLLNGRLKKMSDLRQQD